MHRLIPRLLGILLLSVSCAALANNDTPAALQDWRAWVLEKHPEIRCPFLHNNAQHTCVWPGQLSLDVTAKGAKFEQTVEIFSPAWLTLPGSDNYWPTNVSNGTASLPVRRLDGRPQIFLSIGQHTISGELSWTEIPRTLTIPPEAGLLHLRLNGKTVVAANVENGNQLWLSQDSTAVTNNTQDSVNLRVFRLIRDTIPAQITTRLQLDVSGKERELQLGQLLLDGFTPLSFNSPLPARLESDGSVRMQIKPGSWELELNARSAGRLNEIGYKTTHEVWPRQEIWVFAAESQLRTVQISGATTIDPQQTQLPSEWQQLPAYLLTPDTTLILEELHRGDPNPTANQLTLNKELWLDFDGAGYTVRDQINGSLNQGWRLEARTPYVLGSASLNGDPQLVTRLTEDGNSGVEVRERRIKFSALSRLERQRSLPVSGWEQDFTQVDTSLYLAPGWSLFSASGADRVTGSWVDQWSLWDIFLVLIITVTISRTTRPWIGAVALATLILTYQRSGAPLFIWLNIAAALALLPLVSGKFLRALHIYLIASFFVLVVILLPYSVEQARQAFYPQQEYPDRNIGEPSYYGGNDQNYDTAAAPAPAYESSVEDMVVMQEQLEPKHLSKTASRLSAPEPKKQSLAQEYDPGQQVQTGPGVPQWQWHRIDLHWSGPVKADELTQFYLLPPFLNRLGNLLSLLLPLALGALLLQRMNTGGYNYSLSFLRKTPGVSPALIAALLIPAVLLIPAPPISADVLVDATLLRELETRLTQPPKCLPDCASIEAVELAIDGDLLQINMLVHSADLIALPLPARRQEWWPSEVSANGRRAPMMQDSQGQLLITLPMGRHRISLQGSLQGRDNVTLDFGLPLHNVSSQIKDWQLNGAPQNNQQSDSLQLERLQQSALDDARERLLPDPIPPFVTVTRTLQLGLEWNVETRVQRTAPAQGVINLEIPLLPGEAPTSGQPTPAGKMPIRMGANEQDVVWRSILKQESPLTLTAPEQVPWVEIWALDTAPVWHTEVSGITSVQLGAEQSTPFWQPWPGESITLTVTRPIAVAGSHITIDSVALQQELGLRANNTTLSLVVRANQGGHYDFTLPDDASLSNVTIDGHQQPISHSEGALKIPLRPGEQSIVINWQGNEGISTKAKTPSLNLGMPSSNQSLVLQLPGDRWPLLVGGPAVGPAVLLWGMLAVVLIIAIALGRSGLTPLKTRHWILLSLGICTVNLYALALIAIWLIALSKRGQLQQLPSATAFKWLQVSLFTLSIVSLGILLSSIPYGLLSSPDMHIAGNGSSAYNLRWYQDQSDATLPSAWVISLPMWSYRLVMLVWSLWLALALLGWIRWGWQQLSRQALWHVPGGIADKAETDNTLKPDVGNK